MAKKPPVDPLTGPKLALSGQVVTMDDTFSVLRRGTVYIDQGGIVAVHDATQSPPVGFESTTRIDVGGTIFPGLIELHNHLAYNALRLWHVPRLFTNRGQWGSTAEYQNAAARVDVWRAQLAQAVAQGNVASFIELLRTSGVH